MKPPAFASLRHPPGTREGGALQHAFFLHFRFRLVVPGGGKYLNLRHSMNCVPPPARVPMSRFPIDAKFGGQLLHQSYEERGH